MHRPDGIVDRARSRPTRSTMPAALLAARHRDPAADRAGARPPPTRTPRRGQAEIAAIAAIDGASGAVARRGDELVGYLLGRAAGADRGARTAGSRAPATRSAEPEIVRDLYGFAARRLGRGGRDQPLRRSCRRPTRRSSTPGSGSGFGQQHVHAIREVPDAGRDRRGAARPDASGSRSAATSRRSAGSSVVAARAPGALAGLLAASRRRPSRTAVAEHRGGLRRPGLHDVRRRARRRA